MAKTRSKDIKQILEYEINYAKNENKGYADCVPIKTLKDILALICEQENEIEQLKAEKEKEIERAQLDILKSLKDSCAGVYGEYIPEIIDEYIEDMTYEN